MANSGLKMTESLIFVYKFQNLSAQYTIMHKIQHTNTIHTNTGRLVRVWTPGASCSFDKNSFFFFVFPVIHVQMKISGLSPFQILDILAKWRSLMSAFSLPQGDNFAEMSRIYGRFGSGWWWKVLFFVTLVHFYPICPNFSIFWFAKCVWMLCTYRLQN